MIVKRKEEFKPVIITLETPEEVNLFKETIFIIKKRIRE